jgi:transcription initiation factor TFIID TATA-box-binding protein
MDTLKESLNSHPSTAMQAKAFTSPASLSFPGGAGDLTPPSDAKDMNAQANGQANGQSNGNMAMPATPVATPAAGQGQGVSGIVPTLQ